MERKLAEATNAARARRIRGETGLRRFFAAVFFAAGVFVAGVRSVVFWALLLLDAAFFELDLVGEALCCAEFADFADGAAIESGAAGDAGGADCAPAWNNPGANRKSVSAKTETANLRTDSHLHLKVWTHHAQIVFCETSFDFIFKVIAGSCNRGPVTLLVRRAALVDRILQAIVEIFAGAAFSELGFVIKLDLIDQQARKAPSLAVEFFVFRRHRRAGWRRLGRYLGMQVAYCQGFGVNFVLGNSCGLNFDDRARTSNMKRLMMSGCGGVFRGSHGCLACGRGGHRINRRVRGKWIVESR